MHRCDSAFSRATKNPTARPGRESGWDRKQILTPSKASPKNNVIVTLNLSVAAFDQSVAAR